MGIDDKLDEDTLIEGGDPFDDVTQEMEPSDAEPSSDPPPHAQAGAARGDVDATTTWTRSSGPPVIVEQSEEVPVAEAPSKAPMAEEPLMAPVAETDILPELEPVPPIVETNLDPVATILADSTEKLVNDPDHGPFPSDPLAPSSSLRPLLLERIEPSLGRGERLRLDASNWRVGLGRGEQNHVRLYTAAASREHAEIAGNAQGEWVLTPAAGKVVLIDGDPTAESVVLEVGMNLILGHDHLRCVTEGLGRNEMVAPTLAPGFEDGGEGWSGGGSTALLVWGLGLAAALAGGIALYGWFGG